MVISATRRLSLLVNVHYAFVLVKCLNKKGIFIDLKARSVIIAKKESGETR
jgi:hypothetical protein